jgi:hypothetical protein
MKLDFAFFANAAEVLPNGLMYVLGGGFDVLTGNGFPAPLNRLFLVVRLSVDPSEIDQSHELTCDIIRPTGETMPPEFKIPFKPARNRNVRPGTSTPMTICLTYQDIIIPEVGEYRFLLKADGVEVGSVPLEVSLSREGE